MSDDGPPWREITVDDYRPHQTEAEAAADRSGRAYIAMQATIRDLLQRQLDGEFRLRLVLREACDLAGWSEQTKARQNPYSTAAYRVGDDAIVLCSAEVVIEMRDGRRHRVEMRPRVQGTGWAEGVRGGLRPGLWTTHPLATRYGYGGG